MAAQRKAGCRSTAPGFVLYGPQRGPSHGDQRRQRYAFIPTAGPGRTKNQTPPPIRRTATRTPARIPDTNPVAPGYGHEPHGRSDGRPGHPGIGAPVRAQKKTGRTLIKVRPVQRARLPFKSVRQNASLFKNIVYRRYYDPFLPDHQVGVGRRLLDAQNILEERAREDHRRDARGNEGHDLVIEGGVKGGGQHGGQRADRKPYRDEPDRDRLKNASRDRDDEPENHRVSCY